MTWTCRARDAAGNLLFDGSYQLGRIAGYVDVSANGSMDVPAFSQGVPFFIAVPIATNVFARSPRVTASGTTLSWTYSTDGNYSNVVTRIFYGVR